MHRCELLTWNFGFSKLHVLLHHLPLATISLAQPESQPERKGSRVHGGQAMSGLWAATLWWHGALALHGTLHAEALPIAILVWASQHHRHNLPKNHRFFHKPFGPEKKKKTKAKLSGEPAFAAADQGTWPWAPSHLRNRSLPLNSVLSSGSNECAAHLSLLASSDHGGPQI